MFLFLSYFSTQNLFHWLIGPRFTFRSDLKRFSSYIWQHYLRRQLGPFSLSMCAVVAVQQSCVSFTSNEQPFQSEITIFVMPVPKASPTFSRHRCNNGRNSLIRVLPLKGLTHRRIDVITCSLIIDNKSISWRPYDKCRYFGVWVQFVVCGLSRFVQ